jgi:hypothetical protein
MRYRRQPTNERPEPEDLPAERDDPRSSRSEGGRHLRPWDGQQALIIINLKNIRFCRVLDRQIAVQFSKIKKTYIFNGKIV